MKTKSKQEYQTLFIKGDAIIKHIIGEEQLLGVYIGPMRVELKEGRSLLKRILNFMGGIIILAGLFLLFQISETLGKIVVYLLAALGFVLGAVVLWGLFLLIMDKIRGNINVLDTLILTPKHLFLLQDVKYLKRERGYTGGEVAKAFTTSCTLTRPRFAPAIYATLSNYVFKVDLIKKNVTWRYNTHFSNNYLSLQEFGEKAKGAIQNPPEATAVNREHDEPKTADDQPISAAVSTEITKCPNCKTTVKPMADGTCPACQAKI